MPKISIIVLQYNQSEHTLKCLESLRQLDADVIVVDNGSDVKHLKNVEYWIESNKILNFKLLILNENRGYTGGNNAGIKKALTDGAEHVLILNNDVVLHEMITGDADIVGVEWGSALGFEYLVGFALLIKREVFEKIGFFDERYFLYYDDVEFCVRARKAGFKLALAKANFTHAVSATTSSLGPATLHYYHTRNALLLKKLPFWKIWTTLKQRIKILLGRDVEISRAILQGIHDYDHNRFGMRVR